MDALSCYLREIRRIPRITRAEEISLAAQRDAGDPDAARAAIHQLALGNLRLAASIARRRRYAGRGLDVLDLIQIASVGLLVAASKFQPSRGSFAAAASVWVHQTLNRAIADYAHTIRLPAHVIEIRTAAHMATRRLTQALHREPTPDELALEIGRPVSDVEQALAHRNALSLDAPTHGDEEDARLGDGVTDGEAVNVLDALLDRDTTSHLHAALGRLTPRERQVLTLRYGLNGDGDGCTLEAVGEQMGVTRERVRQIETKAFHKLRHPAHRQRLLA